MNIQFRDSGIIYDDTPSTEVSEKVLVTFLHEPIF